MFNQYIVWNNESHIGVPLLDEQHGSLASTINSLYFSMTMGHPQILLLSTIEAFEILATIHFQVEEEILEVIKYPYIKQHITAHSKVRDQVHTMLVKNKRTSNPNDLLEYFKKEWMLHIEKYDRHYAKYIVDHYSQNGVIIPTNL